MITNYTDILFRYIFINLTTILIFFIVGIKLSHAKKSTDYWKIAFWAIAAYAISMGLRFGRMIDYNLYAERYISIGEHPAWSEYEPVFTFACWAFYNAGFPYYIFICFSNILLIIATLTLLKKYREYAFLGLIIFLREAALAENFIRWYWAYSFFIFSFSYFTKKKYLLSGVLAGLSVLSHIGMIILFFLVVVLSLIKRQLFSSTITEILFLVSLLFGSTQLLGILSPIISLFGVDERSLSYISDYNDIISGNRGTLGYADELSIRNIIQIVLAYSIPIFTIPHLLKKKLITNLEANLFIIGVILNPILSKVEILGRYGDAILFFSIIVSSVSYGYILKNKKHLPKYALLLCYLSIISNIWPAIANAINRTNWWTMLYIWDSGGKDSLPMILFK